MERTSEIFQRFARNVIDHWDVDTVAVDVLQMDYYILTDSYGPEHHEDPVKDSEAEGSNEVEVNQSAPSLGITHSIDTVPGLVDAMVYPPVRPSHQLEREESIK